VKKQQLKAYFDTDPIIPVIDGDWLKAKKPHWALIMESALPHSLHF
jgi:hypothetical protein